MRRPRMIETDGRVRQATRAYAEGRLEDIDVLEWAVDLKAEEAAERSALRDLFDYRKEPLREPFELAWRCIFEFWARPDVETQQDKFQIQRDLKHGGINSETIRLIVDAVRPWLSIDKSKKYRALSGEKVPSKPTQLRHLIWASISSGDRLTSADIGLNTIEDRYFLFELAAALNAALLSGLNLARMVGSISKEVDSTNWLVHRVYFVPAAQYAEGGGEPDRHSNGFAPATKLMFAVVEKLASIDPSAAKHHVASWDIAGWTLYRRLWAAAARNPALVPADEVARFLDSLANQEFWWASSYPEIAEVRALRWSDLSSEAAARLEARLLKGEPAAIHPKRIEKSERQSYVDRRILIELKRIRAAGGLLSTRATKWLEDMEDANNAPGEVDVTYGFNQGVRLLRRVRTVEQTFDSTPNIRLLEELSKSVSDTGWDDKTQNASEYIAENAAQVVKLLTNAVDEAVSAKIWQALGYGFRPVDLNSRPAKASQRDLDRIPLALEICAAIIRERPAVLSKAIDGLVSFAGSWDRLLQDSTEFRQLWLVLWPLAAAKTNAVSDPSEPIANRALQSPAGQMAIAFVEACPEIGDDNPMSEAEFPAMLAAFSETQGEARVHAQFNLLRDLSYFFHAAPQWTTDFLLDPLLGNQAEELWEAVAMASLPPPDIMALLANPIIAASLSNQLPGKVRGDLAERVIASAILSKRDGLDPAIPFAQVQQMLRLGSDEVRAECVRSFADFLEPSDEYPGGNFDIVRSVFEEVWPKELTLSSRSVSEQLARLPAAAGSSYADAAEMVLPYLTPFNSWSLYDFGVIDPRDPQDRMNVIDDAGKAEAFLAILDRSVGGEDGAVIPGELEKALMHIRKLAPRLERDVRFQRLLTLSRR